MKIRTQINEKGIKHICIQYKLIKINTVIRKIKDIPPELNIKKQTLNVFTKIKHFH